MNTTDIQGKLEQLNTALEAKGYSDPNCQVRISTSKVVVSAYRPAINLDLDFAEGSTLSEAFHNAQAEASK